MNAPNSAPQDKRAAERKAYEPSMEEILASIRRIIADDQALASGRMPPGGTSERRPDVSVAPAPKPAPVHELNVSPRSEPLVEPPFADGGAVPLEPPDLSSLATPPQDAAPRLPDAGGGTAVFVGSASFVDLQPEPPPRVEDTHTSGDDESMATRMESVLENLARFGEDDEHAKSEDVRAPETQHVTVPQQEAQQDDALVSPKTDAAVSSAFSALVASRFLQSNEALSEMIRDMLRPMLKTWLDDNLPIMVERLVRNEIERVARGGR